MSTVAEIEAAIEKLPPAEFGELLAWIEERQAVVGASEALFALYDKEEKVGWRLPEPPNLEGDLLRAPELEGE